MTEKIIFKFNSMKTTIPFVKKSWGLLVAVATAAAMLFPGCEKEGALVPSTGTARQYSHMKCQYLIDGVEIAASSGTENASDSLLAELFSRVRQGGVLTVKAQSGCVGSLDANGEPIVFTTPSEREALAWMQSMSEQGYDVTVTYNSKTRLYTCTAVIPDPTNTGTDVYSIENEGNDFSIIHR